MIKQGAWLAVTGGAMTIWWHPIALAVFATGWLIIVLELARRFRD